MKKLILAGLVGFGLLISGCTSIQVNNAKSFDANSIKYVCIAHNPKVIIKDFDGIVERSFARHGVSSRTLSDENELSKCPTVLHYTALRSWDFVPYMTFAQFNLIHNGQQISEASFKLKGNGGMAPNKWRSTETKINELVDVLLNVSNQK